LLYDAKAGQLRTFTVGTAFLVGEHGALPPRE
jgi:hypothetical protein